MRAITIMSWLLVGAGLAHAAAVTPGLEPAASAPSASTAPEPSDDPDAIFVTDADDAANKVGLRVAVDLINQGEPQIAVTMLDRLIVRLEKRYASKDRLLYCGHTQAEVLAYTTLVAASGHDALAVDPVFCDAWFYRGYVNVDLQRLAAAESDFTRALLLSPDNPHYFSEMGELQSQKHDWNRALGYYERARDAAVPYAPESAQIAELTRALHGMGYVDVELGKLDEAEALYRRCLEIDANDEKAKAELDYVLIQRARLAGTSQ